MATYPDYEHGYGYEYDNATNTNVKNTSEDRDYYDVYGYDDDEFSYDDGEYVYDDYLYFGFHFERPIYMFIWPVLVFLATVANGQLIVILLKKKLRNSTNIVLIGIAVAETMTLLVTIPTYVLAYLEFDDGPGTDVYVLTKDWCNAFMICKFFLSKWFRTASVWLHCFLGFHRFMAIWKPFNFLHVLQIRCSTAIIVFLFASAPTPHIYRLLHKHATDGLCGWGVEDFCDDDCHYNWILLLLVDLVPCFFLSLFTVLIVVKLFQSTELLGSTEMLSKKHLTLRQKENRRSSILVTTVVLSLLIPEIPYVVFLVYMETQHHTTSLVDRTDREFHTAYEVLIALSFTTNFFINVALNTTFRNELRGLFMKCCVRLAPWTCECSLCNVKDEYDMNGTSDIPGVVHPPSIETVV